MFLVNFGDGYHAFDTDIVYSPFGILFKVAVCVAPVAGAVSPIVAPTDLCRADKISYYEDPVGNANHYVWRIPPLLRTVCTSENEIVLDSYFRRIGEYVMKRHTKPSKGSGGGVYTVVPPCIYGGGRFGTTEIAH